MLGLVATPRQIGSATALAVTLALCLVACEGSRSGLNGGQPAVGGSAGANALAVGAAAGYVAGASGGATNAALDASVLVDAAQPLDGGTPIDASSGSDADSGLDAGEPADADSESDADSGLDAGEPADADLIDGSTDADGPDTSVAPAASATVVLWAPPLVSSPTTSGFDVNVAVGAGDPNSLGLQWRREGSRRWRRAPAADRPALDVAEWHVRGLRAGSRYQYQITETTGDQTTTLYSGGAVTERLPGDPFTFSLITDSHISPIEFEAGSTEANGYVENTLQTIAAEAAAESPDFVINLGDMLDFHQFGFNQPPSDGWFTRVGYLNYRRLLGDLSGEAAHFAVIGNWDGENGCFTAEEIARSRDARLVYMPGPSPDTYPEGGSGAEDYYAFTWGDALFVVLNVMSYTTTWHLLSSDPGLPDDWTLGDAQLTWLTQTLRDSTSRWKFLFIHHTVGGAAGNAANAAYGRGGGQAAYVGEQAIVQDLMESFGVQIFFYGHDHVFTDMVVGGVHYTLPGSAGAPWKFTQAETGYEQYWSDSGHARVRVTPETVDVQFIAEGGTLLYEYALN